MLRGRAAAYLALCVSVLFWGLSFTASKIALKSLSPFTVLFLRFALAFALLLPLAARRGLPRLSFSEHVKVLGICILFPGGYFALEILGLRLTTATNASLIAAAIPMMVLALTCLTSRTFPGMRSVAGVAASLAGVVLLVGGGGGPVNAGDAMMLGAVASASVYMVAASRLCESVSPVDLTLLQMFWGALFFLPFFAADMPRWEAVPLPALLAVAGLGVFATVAAFLAYNFALSRVPAATASLFINAVPVVAVAGAAAVLGESMGMGQMAGGGLILAAVYASARPPA